jgi:hypothetical protein
MKSHHWAFIALLLLGGPAWSDDIRPAMEAINARFLAAFNTPDSAAFPALYTEDATLIFHGVAPITGPEAIKRFWESRISAGARDHTFDIIETWADGKFVSAEQSGCPVGSANRGENGDFRLHSEGLRDAERRDLENQGSRVQYTERALALGGVGLRMMRGRKRGPRYRHRSSPRSDGRSSTKAAPLTGEQATGRSDTAPDRFAIAALASIAALTLAAIAILARSWRISASAAAPFAAPTADRTSDLMRTVRDEPASAGLGAASASAETARKAVVRTVCFMITPHAMCSMRTVLDLEPRERDVRHEAVRLWDAPRRHCSLWPLRLGPSPLIEAAEGRSRPPPPAPAKPESGSSYDAASIPIPAHAARLRRAYLASRKFFN